MKNLPHFSALFFLASFFFSACGKKETSSCGSLICQNNATCINGTCNCPSGYEGTDCGIPNRNKFLANGGPAIYTYQDSRDSGICGDHYGELRISRSQNDSGKVIITGLCNTGENATLEAKVFNNHIFSEIQRISGTGLNIDLQGEYVNGRITGRYHLAQSAPDPFYCTYSFIWGKK